jgi:FkbH-like protein
VLTVRIKDKFGSDEIIAVVIIKYFSRIAYIDNYVMSCRVMGRGVETAVLADICNRAIMKKCKEIRGEIIELERNTPCREVYSENGFIESEKNIYARSTGDPVKFPKWFNY